MGRYYPKYHVLKFKMHRPHILIRTRVSGCMHIWPNQLKPIYATRITSFQIIFMYVGTQSDLTERDIWNSIVQCNVNYCKYPWNVGKFYTHATDDMLMLNDLVIIKPFTLWSHDNSFRHIYSHLSHSNILNCVILKLPPVAQNVQMHKKIYQIVRM